MATDVLIPTLIDEEQPLNEFDESNPRSLINLLPYEIKRRVKTLNTTYFEITEDEVRQQLFQGDEPPELLEHLRLAFWDEYDRVQKYKEKKILIERVCAGICPGQYFWKKIVEHPPSLIWMLRVPQSYEVGLREIHRLGMRAMRTIMNTPAIEKNGKPNIKLMEVQFKIMQHVDMRQKGAIIQRIDQRHLIAEVKPESLEKPEGKAPPPPDRDQATPPSLKEINEQIEALQHASKKLQVPANVKVDLLKDITPSATIKYEPEKDAL